MSETLHPPASPVEEGANDTWTPLDYPGGLIDGQWMRGQWEGHEQLTCIRCQWDTLRGIKAARERARTCPRCSAETSNEERAPSPVLVADKRGNIIQSGGRDE